MSLEAAISILAVPVKIFRKYEQFVYRKNFEAAKRRIDEKAWKIFTHTTDNEKYFLYKAATQAPRDSTIVEIGSYLGASTCFLSAGCCAKDGHVYAIDTWQNQAMSEGLRDTYQDFIQNVQAYRNFITPIRSFSSDAAENFTQPIDLLFIDGDHSYEGIMLDLDLWIPKLRPMAQLLLHDWGWAEGVQQAIKEVVEPITVGRPKILPNLYAARVDSRRYKL